jgi:hypothetical protein
MAAYVALSGLCVVITNVYALFGHGVRSYYMDLMFLYPLVGAVVFAGLNLFGVVGRFAANAYHAGVASLTVGAMLGGIMEIAWTGSAYTYIFFIAGGLLCAVGIVRAIVAVVASRFLKAR